MALLPSNPQQAHSFVVTAVYLRNDGSSLDAARTGSGVLAEAAAPDECLSRALDSHERRNQSGTSTSYASMEFVPPVEDTELVQLMACLGLPTSFGTTSEVKLPKQTRKSRRAASKNMEVDSSATEALPASILHPEIGGEDVHLTGVLTESDNLSKAVCYVESQWSGYCTFEGENPSTEAQDDEGGEINLTKSLWEPVWDTHYQQYYFCNNFTGETTWELPEGLENYANYYGHWDAAVISAEGESVVDELTNPAVAESLNQIGGLEVRQLEREDELTIGAIECERKVLVDTHMKGAKGEQKRKNCIVQSTMIKAVAENQQDFDGEENTLDLEVAAAVQPVIQDCEVSGEDMKMDSCSTLMSTPEYQKETKESPSDRDDSSQACVNQCVEVAVQDDRMSVRSEWCLPQACGSHIQFRDSDDEASSTDGQGTDSAKVLENDEAKVWSLPQACGSQLWFHNSNDERCSYVRDGTGFAQVTDHDACKLETRVVSRLVNDCGSMFGTATAAAGKDLEDGIGADCTMLTESKRRKKQRLRHSMETMPPRGCQQSITLDTEKAEEITTCISKYWYQRYRLFTKYDEGIKMDEEGWFSVTPETIAEHQASRCPGGLVVDAFAGVGGNAIQFALQGQHVVAIDINPVKIEFAKHNAAIYGVADCIEFIVGDFFQLAPSLKADVVFLSPPWGGPSYLNVENYDLQSMLQPLDGVKLFQTAQVVAPSLVLFLPRNVDIDQVAELSNLAIPPLACEVEKNFVNGKLKAITAYYGDMALKDSS